MSICLYACAPQACLVSKDVRSGHWFPWDWSYLAMSYHVRVGAEPGAYTSAEPTLQLPLALNYADQAGLKLVAILLH